MIKKILNTILLTASIILLVYSLYNIITNYKENKITRKEEQIIKNSYLIENKYDFNYLKTINSDVKGFIKVNNTNIDYPFVQYENNSYYLSHSFEKKKSSAGWIFMDYRNNNFNDLNTIIYGHNRLDKSMFGSLKDLLNKEWLNNKDNHYIKITTENEVITWQIFSIYRINNTSDYLSINFNNEQEYISFLNMIRKRSEFDFNINLTSTNRILTLSTCNGKKKKLVIHALEIERNMI